jgi:hypothetical protein
MLGLRRVGEALRASATEAAAASGADNTIADAYPGVRGGTITVNGHSISVTPGVTTLREVVAALDTIPGLFAAVDSATGTIMVAGLMADKKLEITDSTGLLHALGLQTGVIVPPNAVDTQLKTPLIDSQEKAERVGKAFARVNDAMQRLANGPRELDSLRVAANGAVTKAIESIDGPAAQAFKVESTNGALRVSVDVDRLAGVLRDEPHALGHLLDEGLAKPLAAALEQSGDDAAGASTVPTSPERITLKTPRPPVELFETVLAHAALAKP